jgi:hypothetical protein
MKVIDVGKHFSRFPSGRYEKNGTTSGEAFRKKLLEPALRADGDRVQVLFDGTVGYGSSFLEEAFGGLVRISGFSSHDLLARFDFVSKDDALLSELKEYINEAKTHH